MAKKKTLTIQQYHNDKKLSGNMPISTITWRIRKEIGLPNVRKIEKVHRFYLLEVEA